MPKQIRPKLLAVAIGHALAAMALVRDIVERRKGDEPKRSTFEFVGDSKDTIKGVAKALTATDGDFETKTAGPSRMSGEAEGVSNLPREPKTQREKIAARGGRVLSAQETFETLTGAREPQPGDYVRKIPKRIRSRHKPLTAADIVEGGVYVPKRGNDKTPNFYIRHIDRIGIVHYRRRPLPDDITPGYTFVEDGNDERLHVSDFLALVARRVS